MTWKSSDICRHNFISLPLLCLLFELPKEINIETYIPLFRIYSNCIRFSCHACKESRTVRSVQLTHIDGVSQTSPMGRVVAEPMHS